MRNICALFLPLLHIGRAALLNQCDNILVEPKNVVFPGGLELLRYAMQVKGWSYYHKLIVIDLSTALSR